MSIKTKNISDKDVSDSYVKNYYIWIFHSKGKKLRINFDLVSGKSWFSVVYGVCSEEVFETFELAIKYYNSLID